ncbi:Acyloxyacyl hydrolase-like [Oopsacas minuta]|uniref:Acyloxyacyl hydrolase-like n=1 Tax=Oopsacas minuta TaxID=111878 RepID=A0AAV7JM10_9METZ|nr:Acyloxyacyl hydrolase-like [Oopsacas minuta]
MNSRILSSCVVVLALLISLNVKCSSGNDYNCVGCTLVIGLVLEYVEFNNLTMEQGLKTLCSYLPAEYGVTCKELVNIFEIPLLLILEQTSHPDLICRGLELCKGNSTKCTLYPKSRDVPAKGIIKGNQYRPGQVKIPKIPDDICDYPPFKEICRIIKQVEDHYPAQDFDKDHFSTIRTLRGSSWRGKDCNDFNKDIYPGRGDGKDIIVDTNCNGIVGSDPDTGESYEDMWCKGTQAMGTVILGDSVGAHFHLPEELVNPTLIGPLTYKYLPEMIENELDWPMESAATGYEESVWDPAKGEVISLYRQLRNKNRCNHRDYHNIAVNGAWSGTNSMGKIDKTLTRNATVDKPVFLILALLGNDVCNSHHTMNTMTTVTEFKTNMNAVLDYLDGYLPEKSVVVSVGLADGRVLYDNMHNRIHPAAAFSRDVNYRTFYNFLNCLEISPCFGWLNDNSTWRSMTHQRAMNLSQGLKEVVKAKNFKRIIGIYMDSPVAEMISDWEKQGGKGWELIEPVDGFHTSRMGQAQTAKILYQQMEKNYPEIIPPVNPHNEDIVNMFGTQNGH